MAFNGIIGNEENKLILEKTVKSGKILHSYLFFGISGIGKKIFAREFAKMILCNDKISIPCNMCDSCKKFDSDNNPDFFFIEPDGSSIKIDQIREIQKSILEKPIESKKKVYIIDNADTMTKEAQNCILKTLEEPQDYIVIILIASNENNILPTVKSRCMKMYFNKIDIGDIRKYIEQKYDGKNIDEEIYKLCGGSISVAEEIINKKDILEETEGIIKTIKNTNKLDFFNKSKFFLDNREDINLILDYIYVLLFEELKTDNLKMNAYINAMRAIEIAKNKLSNSNNFDMTIDDMLINVWEEINEKNSRG